MLCTTKTFQNVVAFFILYGLPQVVARGRGGGGGGGGGSSSNNNNEEQQAGGGGGEEEDCIEAGTCVAIGSVRIPKTYFIWGGVVLGLLILSCLCCILWKCGVFNKLRGRVSRATAQRNLATRDHEAALKNQDYQSTVPLTKGEYNTLHSFDQPYHPPYQIQHGNHSQTPSYTVPVYPSNQNSQSGQWTPDTLNKTTPLPYSQGGLGYSTTPFNDQSNYPPPPGAPPRNH